MWLHIDISIYTHTHIYIHIHIYITYVCVCACVCVIASWLASCVNVYAQSCPTLCDPKDDSPPGSSVHGNSPGRNTGVGCHTLLQGIFLTQGLNPGLPRGRQILYHLSHQGRGPAYTYTYTYIYTYTCTYTMGYHLAMRKREILP